MNTIPIVIFTFLVAASSGDRYHPDLIDKGFRNVDALNRDQSTSSFWKNEAAEGIAKREQNFKNEKLARNVILFLGDGMSIPTLAAARILKGQREKQSGEETQMFFEGFPTVGLSKTYCLNAQVADSACSATAYLTGVKANSGTIGVTGKVARRDCPASTDNSTHLDSIAVWALEDGRDAGIVTTTRVTHASPAGVYARVANRNWEHDGDVVSDGNDPNVCPDIAHQLVHTSPGNKFKVILGGGRRSFLPNTTRDEEGTRGRRTDDRNLIEEWLQINTNRGSSNAYVWNRTQLMDLRSSPPEYLLGLFEGGHLQYHLTGDNTTEPTLAELTEVAINSLSRSEKGYFLFVEGGRIDHAHHDNKPHLALDETLEFDLAIKKAVEMTGDDTLIVVTADHAHVMTLNGYSPRGTNILGPSVQRGSDNVPYMSLSYANGPGARTHVNEVRPDVTKDTNFMAPEWMTHVEVPLSSETHGGDDVAVMAYGPQHHMFSGVFEQSQIAWRMAYAACIGPGLKAEACSTNGAGIHHPLLALYAIVSVVLFRLFD